MSSLQFLSLPPELRIEIYRQLILHGKNIRQNIIQSAPIRRTCRRIRSEFDDEAAFIIRQLNESLELGPGIRAHFFKKFAEWDLLMISIPQATFHANGHRFQYLSINGICSSYDFAEHIPWHATWLRRVTFAVHEDDNDILDDIHVTSWNRDPTSRSILENENRYQLGLSGWKPIRESTIKDILVDFTKLARFPYEKRGYFRIAKFSDMEYTLEEDSQGWIMRVYYTRSQGTGCYGVRRYVSALREKIAALAIFFLFCIQEVLFWILS
ncbi:hypothetical protein BS50DRAFT_582086 [Corynespora cassiicola Philippines]|uniref:F-box domain-containing protein n=1 Tax=Corynespora cassiicola Philippines TaxID=1448308 RepID=A0A2T2PDE1_CORCC|nr:hypothetical protein BS50DRAFT_582086 [Corynespora cassiicola Philippines]